MERKVVLTLIALHAHPGADLFNASFFTSGTRLSRANYARLYEAGFEPIRDRNGEPAETVDPQAQISADPAREAHDHLQSNEIVFQFLAMSRSDVDDSVTLFLKNCVLFPIFFKSV